MKRILIILLGLFSVAYGQFSPTSAKSAFKWGVSVGTRDSSAYAANDSLVVVINRQGRMMYRSTDGYWKMLANAGASDYKQVSDTFFTTGYTTRARTKQIIDSLGAVKPSGSGTSGQVTYWNGTNSVTGSSSFTWNNSLLRMGIRNSAAPLAPLHVGNRNENSSVDPVILVSREIDNTTTGNGHGFSDASRFLRSGNVAYNSFDGRINIAGPNNYDHYVAFQHAPYNTSTGTIGYVSGLATATNTDAGTITNNSGVYVLNPLGVGTITNNYGILIDPQTRGINNFGVHSSIASANGRWNFYAPGTARNFFRGITHIGDTVTYDGSPNLSVTGKAWISDSLRAGVTTIGNLSSTGVQRFNRGTLTFTFNPSYNNANIYSQIQASSSFAIATGGDNNRIYIDGTTGSIGIAQTTTVGNVLRATKTLTGASSSNGILLDGAVQSDVTSQASYFRTNISTQSTSFTAASISHFRASQSTIGAGSTVTEQNGFNVDNTLTGAVNNYAFRGQLSSGSGRFNQYMDGSADNYFNGNTLIGTLSNPDNFKLIVSGGIFGSFVSGSNYRINGAVGGWDRKYAIFGSGGTDRGGFGALGGTDAITKYYIGQNNTDNVAEFDATTKQTSLFGRLAAPKIVGTGSAPSVTLGANITGSVAVVGTDLAGTVTVTLTGASGLVALNELFTLTYNSAYTSAPHVVWSPSSENAATLLQAAGGLYLKNNGTSSFQIAAVNSYTTPASATYSFTYHVIQ